MISPRSYKKEGRTWICFIQIWRFNPSLPCAAASQLLKKVRRAGCLAESMASRNDIVEALAGSEGKDS